MIPKGGEKMANRKVTISMEQNLLDKVDAYANSFGVSRTASISFLVVQGLQVALYPEIIDKLGDIVSLTSKGE